LERKNNKTMIECYGFSAELSPEVAEESLSLYRPGREEDSKRLISYSIGCMMGRYSLDKPGLIYARSDNRGFDPANYRRFPAVDDGIIPLTEYHWFDDDVADRIEQFIVAAWPEESLEGNLEFVAESLFPGSSESPRNRLRRYLATDFYKHHLARYKRRPIYWLFSSGRLRGFQAIVYLHRYNEGTLTRMRTEYVTRLLGKMSARLEYLQGPGDQDGQRGEIGAATSAIIKRKLEKERDTIKKQRAEVQAFDAKLRHYADQRLLLNLDDGVRVNYRKFGDLLAEVKAVT
jgi:type II restriction/modification system DNA methylase subunit YeeA